jgi:hypothetical protein
VQTNTTLVLAPFFVILPPPRTLLRR